MQHSRVAHQHDYAASRSSGMRRLACVRVVWVLLRVCGMGPPNWTRYMGLCKGGSNVVTSLSSNCCIDILLLCRIRCRCELMTIAYRIANLRPKGGGSQVLVIVSRERKKGMYMKENREERKGTKEQNRIIAIMIEVVPPSPKRNQGRPAHCLPTVVTHLKKEKYISCPTQCELPAVRTKCPFVFVCIV